MLKTRRGQTMRTMKKSRVFLGFFYLFSAYFLIQPAKLITADEKYPTKQIKFIVPVAAGFGTDISCRKWVLLVEKSLGQEIIIENKVGAGTIIGATFLAKSKPDGYTIGAIMSSIFATTPHLTKLDFDPLTAFTPILQWADIDQMLLVPMNSPIKTFKEFIEEGHKRQIQVSGTGMTSPDIAMEILAAETRINLKVVPFGGGVQAITAALGGQVDAAAVGGGYEYVKSGKMRIIARLNGKEEDTKYGVIPTLKGLGYNVEALSFTGLVGPKGLPEHVKTKLEEDFTRALHDLSMREIIQSCGYTLMYRNSNDFDKYLKEVYERSRKDFIRLGLGIYAKEKK